MTVLPVLRALGHFFLMVCLLIMPMQSVSASDVALRDVGRFEGWRGNALVGYGIVTGLAGTGDSPQNEISRQTLSNVLSRLGLELTPEQIRSRNVAAVIVTAVLPPSANIGDRLDVKVSSIGDARSLVGGTLLMTPLMGPDQQPYALAQGSLVVGGYSFEDSYSLRQRNFPTSAAIPEGATVEVPVEAELLNPKGELRFHLKEPDFTTATRVSGMINQSMGYQVARVTGPDTVVIATFGTGMDPMMIISRVENIRVSVAEPARIVINERTGTVVSGGNVRISDAVIVQGDIRVSVLRDDRAVFPSTGNGIVVAPRGLVLRGSDIDVREKEGMVVLQMPDSTVADLVQALDAADMDIQGIISVLQALKAAGALHGEIIIQ